MDPTSDTGNEETTSAPLGKVKIDRKRAYGSLEDIHVHVDSEVSDSQDSEDEEDSEEEDVLDYTEEDQIATEEQYDEMFEAEQPEPKFDRMGTEVPRDLVKTRKPLAYVSGRVMQLKPIMITGQPIMDANLEDEDSIMPTCTDMIQD